jgi:hypothetical protein
MRPTTWRAFKFFSGFQGGNGRAGLLRIVRSTSYSFLNKNLPANLAEEFDEKIHTTDPAVPDAEAAQVRRAESRMAAPTLCIGGAGISSRIEPGRAIGARVHPGEDSHPQAHLWLGEI